MNGKRGKGTCLEVNMGSKRAWLCADGNGLAEKGKVVMWERR